MLLTPWVRRIMIATAVLSITGALARAWLGSRLPVALLLEPAALLGRGSVVPGIPALWQPLTYPFLILSSPLSLLLSLLVYGWFAGTLEAFWGSRRFLTFFALLAVIPALVAVLLSPVWPALAGQVFEGPDALLAGLVVAWGVLFKDREILLFFVLPVKGVHLVWLTLGMVALGIVYSGAVAPFVPHLVAMALAGLVLAGLWRPRRLVLLLRKWRLERQIARERRARAARAASAAHLRVVDDTDDEVPPSERNGHGRGGGQGPWLN